MKQIGLALGVALIGALAACGGGGGNGAGNASTFIQFQTDGRTFHVDGAELDVRQIKDHPGRYDVHLMGEGFDKPNMSLIFHLFLDDPAAIAGRTVDYHDVPDDMRIPLAVFELGDDVSVTQRLDQSSFTIMFGQVQDGIISGSFSGDGFVVGALHSDVMRPTNVTGAFRARLLRE
jgi:hypothetical protein